MQNIVILQKNKIRGKMENLIATKILQAVMSDNESEFSRLVTSNSDLKIRFGRFPLLSVCYLFKSYKILTKFEIAMLGVGNYQAFDEVFVIYKTFKKYAKKALRLYCDGETIVQPAEMLAILDDRNHLATNYKKLYKTDKVVQNIKKIYILNKNTDINISTAKLEIKCGRLMRWQKLSAIIVATVLAIFLSLTSSVILGINFSSGLGTTKCPIVLRTEEEFLKALDGGSLVYKLDTDIKISSDYSAKNFSGVLDGNGYKIFASDKLGEGLVKKLSGTIQNLNIEIFDEELLINGSYSVFASEVTGNIYNCTASGKLIIDCKLENTEATSNAYISIFATINNGNIVDCNSDVFVEANNASGKNAYLSGIVGENFGTISSCKNNAESFVSDTVDLAGLVAINIGKITDSTNNAKLVQTSSLKWLPNCAGIAITNEGLVEGCNNTAEISATSTLEEELSDKEEFHVYCSGIVVDNVGEVNSCKNSGNILGESKLIRIYLAGIVCRNLTTNNNKEGIVFDCEAKCNIFATSDNGDVYASGAVCINTSILDCVDYFGIISTSTMKNSFSAGICTYNLYGKISGCRTNVNFDNKIFDPQSISKSAAVAIIIWDFSISGNKFDALLYLSNNKYVKNSTFSCSVWQFSNFGGIWNSLEDIECGCEGVKSENELGLEAD